MHPHRALAAAPAPSPASSAPNARVLAAAEAENTRLRETLKALVGVDAVTVSTKGIDYASLTVKGRASHAGGAPEAGRHALVEIAHPILQLQDLGDKEKGTSLNWTVFRGGTKPNIIPEDAKAEGDMRYFLPSEYDRVLAQARKILEIRRVPDTPVAFERAKGRPPLPHNPATERLGARAQAIYGEMDLHLALAEIGCGMRAMTSSPTGRTSRP